MDILTIGIDPGKNGAVVVLVDGRSPLVVAPTANYLVKGVYVPQILSRLLAPYGNVGVGTRVSAVTRVSKLLLDALDQTQGADEDDLFWDTVDDLRRLLYNNPVAAELAVIEQQATRPGEGTSSSFAAGMGFGMWQGLLTGNMIPYEVVTPKTWTKSLNCAGGEGKDKHVEVCAKLLPELQLVQDGCRKPHDGVADAGLLALYAYRRIRSARE